MMERILITICLGLGLSTNLFSQSLKRETIGALGTTQFGESYYVKQTIGQPSNTQRFEKPGIVLRQGFQQPENTGQRLKECDACGLQVSPNPLESQSNLTIPLNTATYGLSIGDLQGRLVFKKEGLNQTELILTQQSLAAGTYLIQVVYTDGCYCSTKLIVK